MAVTCHLRDRGIGEALKRSSAYPDPMKIRRLSCGSRGGVYVFGTRPSNTARASRTMASARKPRVRSRCLAQPTAVATPRRTNAMAPAFCRNWVAAVKVFSHQGGPGWSEPACSRDQVVDDEGRTRPIPHAQPFPFDAEKSPCKPTEPY